MPGSLHHSEITACQRNSKSVQLDVHNHGWQQSQETLPNQAFGGVGDVLDIYPPASSSPRIHLQIRYNRGDQKLPKPIPPIAIAERSVHDSEYVSRGGSTLVFTNWKVTSRVN